MPGSDTEKTALRVLHLIPDLSQGGAEAALATLLAAPRSGIEHAVCMMVNEPCHFPVKQKIFHCNGRRGMPTPALILGLRRAMREVRPHVLHCWMYHANMLSVAALGLGADVIWSIHSESPAVLGRSMTRTVSIACARLSSVLPRRIVYVADAARENHEAMGYDAGRGMVIHNGIDTVRFDLPSVPRPQGGVVRLGMIARYAPAVKGHHFLIDVLASHPLRHGMQLLFAGQGCDTAPELRDHLAAAGLLERTRLLGAVATVERLYAELDILVLPSQSEALPMTILEGAATGLTICASRVGDIGRLGLPEAALFERGNAADCARALDAAVALARRPGEAQRQRSLIESRFRNETFADRYTDLYRSIGKPLAVPPRRSAGQEGAPECL